jgi:hypothetical protein
MSLTGRARAAAVGAALLTMAVVAPTASALTITSLSVQPASTQAGSHPDFTLSMRFGGGSTPRAISIALPPGFVGNPNAAARCARASFQAGACGADSVVGSTTVYTVAGLGDAAGGGTGGGTSPAGGGSPVGGVGGVLCGLLPILCPGSALKGPSPQALRSVPTGGGASPGARRQVAGLPLPADGTVYNLEPSPGEPARLGIEVRPAGGLLGEIRLQSPVSVRDDGDFGLTSTLDGLPTTFNGLATQITGLDLTLNGQAAGGQRFVTLPTSCATATTTVAVTPYSGATASGSASFTPTGCDAVPFTPSLDVVPATTRVDRPSAYAIRLGVPGEEDPVRQSHVSRVRVTLPPGTALNPGVAAGLQTCSDAAFARGSRSDPACPVASVVGRTSFTSPLVGTLNGTVYEADPVPGQMLRVFVDVPGPGLRIKLVGAVDADPVTGQVTSTFTGLPPLPFTEFTLGFRGGDGAILVTPPTCGPAVSSAQLIPDSGGPATTPSSHFVVSVDGTGAACPDPLPFAPRLAATATPATAGAPTTTTTTISRDDGTQRLRDMAISFPPGLLGGLGNGVSLCDVDRARAATCPADSRVGSATLVAGPGGAPLRLGGEVFLTAPIDGSLAGLAITVPGKVGPFDLGTTVSLARIAVRPGDSGLDVTASGLPAIVGGIPLDLRQIALRLDRPGFMRNATSCAAQQLTATFTSTADATAQASAPYRATGCDDVAFRPRLSGAVATRQQLAKGAHPTVTAVVAQGAGQIATRAVTVTLPKEVGADIANLGRTCMEGEDCDTRNIVGRATAVTPLLPLPLSGDVRLVTPRGGGLPQLRLNLQGLLSLTLTGKTSLTREGRVVNAFEGIPDVPLSRFVLTIDGGPTGILRNLKRLSCGATLTGDAQFVGHSDAKRSTSGPFEVCATVSAASTAAAKAKAKRAATVRARLVKGRLVVSVRGARAVQAVRLSLPAGMSLSGRRAVAVRATAKSRPRLAVSRRALRVSGLSSRAVRVTLGRRGLHGAAKARHAKRSITVRVRTGKAAATVRARIR